jgi:hypothetical protein
MAQLTKEEEDLVKHLRISHIKQYARAAYEKVGPKNLNLTIACKKKCGEEYNHLLELYGKKTSYKKNFLARPLMPVAQDYRVLTVAEFIAELKARPKS